MLSQAGIFWSLSDNIGTVVGTSLAGRDPRPAPARPRRARPGDESARFGFRWFLPALTRHRRLFAEVLAASFFLQLFALVTPLFFQVIIDKVLVHRGLTTLDVLAVGLLLMALFEMTLGGLRGWADGDRDGRITSGELHGYVTQTMRALVRDRRQRPTLVGDDDRRIVESSREKGPDIAKIVVQASGRSR